MNLNWLAREIALKEGGKKQVNIGQIKEILKITIEELGRFSDDEILKTVERYRE